MRSTAIPALVTLAFAGLGFCAASEASNTLSFSTGPPGNSKPQQPSHKKALRQRRAAAVSSVQLPKSIAANDKKVDSMSPEDKEFWDRILDESLGSLPPTQAPSPCPVRIELECVSADGTACSELEPPASLSGDDCIVEVEFKYTIINDGDDVERIYSVEVTRGGVSTVLTDLPDVVPTANLPPGGTVVITETVEVNICQEGSGAFDTEASVLAGPPCDVEVEITCESEEGEECMAISQPDDPDDCLLDVTYTYTVDNTGLVDANIVLFTREREGDFADLMPLLDSTFLEIAGTTLVEETEEIDRCVEQTFTTNTVVEQLPNPELLCKDTGFYP